MSNQMIDRTYETLIPAPRPLVFDVAADRLGYARITPLRKIRLDRNGVDAPQGKGAIHRFTILGPWAAREEMVTFEPGERIQYRLLSGLPVHDHLTTITFHDEPGGGTRMVYRLQTWAPRGLPPVAIASVGKTIVMVLFGGVRREVGRRQKQGAPC